MLGRPLALIVENSADVALIFALALEEAGFETEIISSGDAAQTRLVAAVPALVMLDLHLPGVDGADILRQIRADPRLVDTRVLLATADPQWASALRHDVDLVLIKPIGFFELCDLAARLSSDLVIH